MDIDDDIEKLIRSRPNDGSAGAYVVANSYALGWLISWCEHNLAPAQKMSLCESLRAAADKRQKESA